MSYRTGKPCPKCGGNLYQKHQWRCVPCQSTSMKKANKLISESRNGWPKPVKDWRRKMAGVFYGGEA